MARSVHDDCTSSDPVAELPHEMLIEGRDAIFIVDSKTGGKPSERKADQVRQSLRLGCRARRNAPTRIILETLTDLLVDLQTMTI